MIISFGRLFKREITPNDFFLHLFSISAPFSLLAKTTDVPMSESSSLGMLPGLDHKSPIVKSDVRGNPLKGQSKQLGRQISGILYCMDMKK